MSAPPANDASRAPSELRLYATLAGVLVCAIALAALYARGARWTNTAETPKRFLGLDEPAQAVRTAR
jgi:hypothetical protein